MLDLRIQSRLLVIQLSKMLHMLWTSWFLVAVLALVVGSGQLYPVFRRLHPLGGLENDPVFPV